MPISRAASGSCAVARMARPIRLWLMNVVSSRTSGIVTADREHVTLVDDHPADREELLLRLDEIRNALLRAADPEDADVLEDERHAHGGDQRRQLGRRSERPVGHPFDHHVQRPAGDHRDYQRCEQSDDQPEDRRLLGETDDWPEPDGRDERADHEHLAVGEVDQLDDSVDERVAERDQRPDRAVGQTGDEVVAEPREIAVNRQVMEAERNGHDQEDGDEAVLADVLPEPGPGC